MPTDDPQPGSGASRATDDDTRMPGVPGGTAADPDPDATVIVPSAGPQRPVDGDLPPGHRLEQFEVHTQLGRGGFSIVYKVFDHRLEQFRALKEYFPRGFAVRADGLRVQPRSARDEEIFGIGLDHFVSEGKTLAKFNHPSLVHVYQTIEANGTAYMVMHLAQGDTLEDAVTAMPAPPDEAWLMKLLDPLTAALNVVHDAGVVHRDIKPENIVLLQGSQRPVLLDFGAARQVIDRAGQPTGILTPGYAPIEQYPDSGLQQGPWTDIYALAASVHRLLTGKAPPNAMARQMRDGYEPLARRLGGRYSDRLLKTLDACLATDPAKRPRTIDDLRGRLGLQVGAFDPVAPPAPGQARAVPGRGSPLVWSIAGAVALLVVGGGVFMALNGGGRTAPASAGAPPTTTPTTTPASVPAPPAQDPAAAVVPPAPAPQTAQPAASPSAPQVAATAAAPLPTLPSAPSLPSEPGAAFDHIVSGAAADFGVRLQIDQPRLTVDKTPFRLRLTSAKAGHFYVLIHDTDGEVRVLHPDDFHPDTRIAAGQTLHWPAKGEDRPFGDPLGKARILVLVSGQRLDFDRATRTRDSDWRVLFKDADARKAAAGQPDGRHLYLGRPLCPNGGPCDAPYGAASAAIEVVPAR